MNSPRLIMVAAAICGTAVIAAGCGGDAKNAPNSNPSAKKRHAAQSADIAVGSTSIVFGSAEDSRPLVVPNLPGVTVVGEGEARGAPDKAVLRLTIGSGNEFSGPEGVAPEPIEEAELQPVVQGLKQAGALANTITVNTYAASPYSGFGSAGQITMTWPRPREIDKAVEAAQEVVRAKTRFSLQNVETLFTTSACASLEERAWKAAVADAQRRARRLARLTGAGVGPVISVSEAGIAASPYFGSGSQGCQALRSLPPSSFGPSFSEGTPDAVKVRVSLQVTFAFTR